MSAAPAAAPAPWERAHHFAAYLGRLSPGEWDDVLQRVHAVDAAAHTAAVHHVAELLEVHPELDAFGVLQRTVCAAAPPRTRAGRIATHAAFALALHDALSPREFAALYGPFARPEPSPGEAGSTAPGVQGHGEHHGEDRRVAVDALAEVARPLGGV